MKNKLFYTYLWLRENGTPYYVGKGTKHRAMYDKRHRVHRPTDFKRIILQEWPSEKDALVAENFLISYYGRIDLGTGCLHNLTDGGERNSGFVQSPETRLKHSVAMKGKLVGKKFRPRSEEAIANSRKCRLGQPHPHKGQIFTLESRQRMRESRLRWLQNNLDVRRAAK